MPGSIITLNPLICITLIMTTFKTKDADGAITYMDGLGEGTEASPFASHHYSHVLGVPTTSFGHVRVAQPNMIFEDTSVYGLSPIKWETALTGDASIVEAGNTSSVDLHVSTADGDKAIKQTRQYFHYQPGKGHQILFTLKFDAGKPNLRQRAGYFDDNDGIFFELYENDLRVVLRSSVSGSVVDTVVSQENWNQCSFIEGDEHVLDITKCQIFFIDLQWLGVGQVRLGMDMDGKSYECHRFSHANAIEHVYMMRPNLPIRYEIENVGSVTTNSEMMTICATVISEGGNTVRDRDGAIFSASLGNDTVTVGSTEIPMISIRMKPTFKGKDNRALVYPLDINFIVTSNDIIHYKIIQFNELAGAVWSDVDSDSCIEVDTSATSRSGGNVLTQGYINQKSSITVDTLGERASLVNSIDGNTPSIFTLVCQNMGTNANVATAMTWKEIL